MKNKFTTIFSLVILLTLILGCGSINPLSSKDQPTNDDAIVTSDDKSATDQVIDNALREKTGVPECDKLLDFFADQSHDKDDGYIARATKEYFFNNIRRSLKESIEKNKGNNEKMATECKDYMAQIKKFQSEEKDKK